MFSCLFLYSDYVKSALSSEEVDGTVSSWPPQKKGDQKTEDKETKVTRTNSGADKPEDSEKVNSSTNLLRLKRNSVHQIIVIFLLMSVLYLCYT